MRTSCSADCKNCSNGASLSFGFANYCALNPTPGIADPIDGVSTNGSFGNESPSGSPNPFCSTAQPSNLFATSSSSVSASEPSSPPNQFPVFSSAPDNLFATSYSSRPRVSGSVPSYASAAASVPSNAALVFGGSSSALAASSAINTSTASEIAKLATNPTPADTFMLHPTVPPSPFNFSTTPLHCFSNFTSSDPSSSRSSPFATIRASSKEKGEKIASPGKETSKPTSQLFPGWKGEEELRKESELKGQQTSDPSKKVGPSCGHTVQAEFGGTGLASYIGICDENSLICSISAMPVFKDKSHEELRLEAYQMRSRARNQVDQFNKSTISAQQPQLALPIFVLTMMPTNNSGGFGINSSGPTLGSSVGSFSLTQIGTVPATLSVDGLTIRPTFAESLNAIPLHHASGSSTGFGSIGTSPATHHVSGSSTGFGSIGTPPTTHHASGSSTGFGSFGVPPATHHAFGSSTGFGLFGGLPSTQHASGSSSGFGLLGAPPTTQHASGSSSGFGMFGAPPAMQHASGSSSGLGSFGTTPAMHHTSGSSSGFGLFGPITTTPYASGFGLFGAPTTTTTHHASGSSAGLGSFSFGAPTTTHHAYGSSAGLGSFGAPTTMHHAYGSSGFGSFGAPTTKHHASGSSSGFGSFGAPTTTHPSGSSSGFGSFGAPTTTHHAFGSSTGFGSSGAPPTTHHGAPPAPAPTWVSSAVSTSPAHHVTIAGCGTLLGAACSNTGLFSGQNVGAILSAEPQSNAATQINGAL